ncbi:eCIS core domain-containing protein [Saccharothrix sp. NRRL B-16348]|uniref:eCIS core domain-containing protein n=1 Tax=Saccharothrix sp. NRRL B-16348 TaxID=1415542 RepID=UPI0006AE5203|nr:DUF4157 domain-containing protein [Saccharothrix sp. NRRL B-16348]
MYGHESVHRGTAADRRRATDPAAHPHPEGTTTPRPQELLSLQRRIGNAAVARLVSDLRDDEEQTAVQRSEVPGVLRSPGQPLDRDVRTEMEARLGADFSDVRLHTGPAAQRSATEIGAKAYTSGNHVVVGEGGGDLHTLTHELVHVVQQRSGPVTGTDRGDGLALSHPQDAFEQAAEATARRAMSGSATSATTPAGGHDRVVQRTPADTRSHGDTAASAVPDYRSTRAASRPNHNTFLREVYRRYGTARRARGNGGGNFAVLHYEYTTSTGQPGEDYIGEWNDPGQQHSEMVLVERLNALHGPHWQPIALFSDNHPCSTCVNKLQIHVFPRQRTRSIIPVHYIVGYQEPTWSNQERHTEIARWWT